MVKYPDQLLGDEQRNADGRFCGGGVRQFVGASQPAVIPGGIGQQGGLAVAHHPARQALVEDGLHLFAGGILQLVVVINCSIQRVLIGIQHDEGGSFGAYILHGKQQDALQQAG